jgi:hypothetical protein
METIGVGIVSGIFVTFIVFVFQCLWVNAIQPWYEERVYKDARIEGGWKITYPSLECEEHVELKRKGHTVTGVVIVMHGNDQGKSYKLEGTFKNLILTASYSADNPRTLDRGSFALLLGDNGNRLRGHSVIYHDEKNSMDSAPCVWNREVG